MHIGWMQATAAGFLLGIGFVVPALWWLGFIAVVWSLYCIKTAHSYTQLVKLLCTMWWIKSLCSLSWYVSIFPIQWIDIPDPLYQVFFLIFYWATSSAWLALGVVVLAILGRFLYVQKFISEYFWYCCIPLVWLVSEVMSGVTFAIFSFGPGSIFDSYFVSLGMAGYLFGVSTLGVWLAGVEGVYGLSVLLVGTASLTLLLIEKKRFKYLLLFFVMIAVMNVWVAARPLVSSNIGVTVISVDTQFDAALLNYSEGAQIKSARVRTAVDQAIALNPTFVLLPEDSRYLESQYNSLYPNQAMSMFLFTHKDTESILIDSGRHQTENGLTVLRANVFDGVRKKMWQFDKQYLVPQGEYIPYLYRGIFSMAGFSEAVNAISKDSAYRPGPLLQTSSVPAYLPGLLFCFESISPTSVAQLTQKRPLPFVAHPVSHAWFHTPTILWHQLDVMLQIQARYSGVPIVSAGNMTTGKLYLPNGRIDSGNILKIGDRYLLREFKL